jgi:hypothetical protein
MYFLRGLTPQLEVALTRTLKAVDDELQVRAIAGCLITMHVTAQTRIWPTGVVPDFGNRSSVDAKLLHCVLVLRSTESAHCHSFSSFL